MTELTGPPRSWLAYEPRDTLFVRDGRSFDAAATPTGQAVHPWPSTLAGATGAAYGQEPAEVVGPVLARSAGSRWLPYFPAPRDLVVSDEPVPYVFRLAPTTLDVATDLGAPGPQRWLIPPEEGLPVEPLAGWLPGHLLSEYLGGTLPAAGGLPRADLDVEAPIRVETRVGLARTGRQVKTGFLYQAGHLRLEEGWGFLAGSTPKPDQSLAATGPVPLGGRARLADVRDARDVGWPTRPQHFPGGRVLVYVATAAVWPSDSDGAGGWRLPLPKGASLVAAATGDPEPVATISPRAGRGGSRALRWAVPAGSVYLLQFGTEDDAARWCATVHGTAYGRSQDDRLRTAGFGVVLTGVWT